MRQIRDENHMLSLLVIPKAANLIFNHKLNYLHGITSATLTTITAAATVVVQLEWYRLFCISIARPTGEVLCFKIIKLLCIFDEIHVRFSVSISLVSFSFGLSHIFRGMYMLNDAIPCVYHLTFIIVNCIHLMEISNSKSNHLISIYEWWNRRTDGIKKLTELTAYEFLPKRKVIGAISINHPVESLNIPIQWSDTSKQVSINPKSYTNSYAVSSISSFWCRQFFRWWVSISDCLFRTISYIIQKHISHPRTF